MADLAHLNLCGDIGVAPLFAFISEQEKVMFLLLLPLLMSSIASSADLANVNLCDGAAGCCGTGFIILSLSYHYNIIIICGTGVPFFSSYYHYHLPRCLPSTLV